MPGICSGGSLSSRSTSAAHIPTGKHCRHEGRSQDICKYKGHGAGSRRAQAEDRKLCVRGTCIYQKLKRSSPRAVAHLLPPPRITDLSRSRRCWPATFTGAAAAVILSPTAPPSIFCLWWAMMAAMATCFIMAVVVCAAAAAKHCSTLRIATAWVVGQGAMFILPLGWGHFASCFTGGKWCLLK